MSERKLQIYLDSSATTPVDPRVAQEMCRHVTSEVDFGNPASRSRAYGWPAEVARAHVAPSVNADPKKIVWTSGATGSDNLAIKGAAHFYSEKRQAHRHLQGRAQSGARYLSATGARRL